MCCIRQGDWQAEHQGGGAKGANHKARLTELWAMSSSSAMARRTIRGTRFTNAAARRFFNRRIWAGQMQDKIVYLHTPEKRRGKDVRGEGAPSVFR